ncbi:dihydrolipoamide acetyltransferase family protein [Acidaminobacter hydrogenoformans]|uniref:Dihydrolipoamide acetyltransferase component of pyruvate dehydrogenase complex n=1 Tax=Acidaminobacter hydrogenoformans DSM 2784 TaxID=1120920 RepID=A0A1G5S033_9FIRM|nr:dihydrolipoamide acetyltransferase family protein [Acidaminobacter hydrogenoformans]SCZ79478.1 pyruvate dehydrogenase E2 component (dihydrolipoamide acetyltransferase) [Acidaminobacter hydrogenoformans DSM 2784]
MGQLIVMPKLGLTMTEGKIVKWYKQEGDVVQKGDAIFGVETDKLTNDIDATVGGVLRKIIHADGIVQVLKPVGIIAEADEDISGLLAQTESVPVNVVEAEKPTQLKEKNVEKAGNRIMASPKAKKLAKELGINLENITGTGMSGSITEQDVLDYDNSPQSKVKSSPAAEKLAAGLGIEIEKIQKNDRIMKDDVVEYWNFKRLQEMAQPEEYREGMSAMRRVISERMSYSQNTSATVNYSLSVDTREMQRLRENLKPIFKVTYTDIIVKILSRVLLEFPLLNASVDDDEIITRNFVNMGVAVALNEGLIVPVIKYANVKGIEAISEEIKSLAEKARTNTLQPDEMTGGTFTVTNLGMFGIESFTPIINQPEVAIMGINTIKEVATNVNGQLQFIPMMNLSLTADHRVVDGSVAAQFMNRVKEYMENPSILML